MKEVICINVGQAGVQMSNAAWELFCIEHGLDAEGFPRNNSSVHDDLTIAHIGTFFHETNIGRYVPRAINIDLEPTVIDEIRSGVYRKLWHPNCLINGIEDAANNFARGRYTIGKKISKKFFNQLLKLVRESEHLHGFIIMNSLGGGTGSGLTSLLIEKIDYEFAKHTKVCTVIYPAPQLATSVVEPYNAVLGTTSTITQTDLVFLCDNEAMYEICYDKLNILRPHYTNLNRIVAQLFSSLTVSFRFGASLDHDLVQLQTNLVPYPRIHFPFANYSPLENQNCTDHETLTTAKITRDLFEESSQLVKCDITKGKYVACCIQYRGLVVPREVNSALIEIKNRQDIEFVDWCPTGFKVGISPMPPVTVYNSQMTPTVRNVTMLSNSTAIEQAWSKLINKFDLLYCKQAFTHWFVGEGMEEGEFKESKEMILQIQKDYQELGLDYKQGCKRDQPLPFISNEDEEEDDETFLNADTFPINHDKKHNANAKRF